MKKSYDFKFKSCVALEAPRGELTVAEITGKYRFIRIRFIRIRFSSGKRNS